MPLDWERIWTSVHNPIASNAIKTSIWNQLHLNSYTTATFNKMFAEVKRLQILLNKTREEYASKEDLRHTSNRIVETLNRLEDKLDKVLSK